jgi:hypothetical protein
MAPFTLHSHRPGRAALYLLFSDSKTEYVQVVPESESHLDAGTYTQTDRQTDRKRERERERERQRERGRRSICVLVCVCDRE